jgi:hypothetical protein
MNATVVSLTKKKGMSWGMADFSIVCPALAVTLPVIGDYYHLLWSDLRLLALTRSEGRARHHGWADGDGRAECSPREGAEEAGIHVGLSVLRVSALLRGLNWRFGAWERGIDALEEVTEARRDER